MPDKIYKLIAKLSLLLLPEMVLQLIMKELVARWEKSFYQILDEISAQKEIKKINVQENLEAEAPAHTCHCNVSPGNTFVCSKGKIGSCKNHQ